jgi:hypothetical protein
MTFDRTPAQRGNCAATWPPASATFLTITVGNATQHEQGQAWGDSNTGEASRGPTEWTPSLTGYHHVRSRGEP